MRMPFMHLPLRMTVIRIGEALWVHSPVELSDELAREVDELGRVAWIVGPNSFHHLRLRPWRERWPQAELWAAPGLEVKRSDLAFTGVLPTAIPTQWSGHIEAVALEGAPKLGEVVFFHVPSRSLVCTDLVFNIQNPRGWAVWPILKLMGTYKRFAASSFWKLLAKDRARLAASIERVLAWDIERIVMAHGEIVDTEAHRRLADALAWMREGRERAPGDDPTRRA
ncbi:MAG TPA: DUF4336 domain-containing protein, partial [Nannocystaceae bacterium]|nr:DUF4336 domain-containing protein [Nannocystaceae bacterium]